MGELSPTEDLGFTDRYHRAARVIGGWLKDPRFTGKDGNPRDLGFENDRVDASFTTLVRAYSGDVPPRAVLDELQRAGAVEPKDGLIRLVAKGYIPKGGAGEKLHILGMGVRDLISSIDHNLVCRPSDAFLQRQVSYDNIPEDRIHEVKMRTSVLGESFIASVDKMMSTYDRDVTPSIEGAGRQRAILGVYYFQE